MQAGVNSALRQDIADVLIENQLGEGQFIHEQIYPIIPVDAQSGRFASIAFSEVKQQVVDDKRSSGMEYNEVTHEPTTDTYTCQKHGLVEPVDSDDAITLGRYFDAEVAAADLCRYYIRLNREVRVANVVFNPAVVTFTGAVTTPWATAATAIPVSDVEGAKRQLVRQLNGMVGAGSRIIGVGNDLCRQNLRATTDILNRWQGGNTKVSIGNVSDEQLAAALGLDAVYFSGLERPAGTAVWNTDRFGIYVVSDSPNIRTVPRIGNTMLWRQSTPSDLMVDSWYEESRESNMIRVKTNTDEKLLTIRAGYILTNVD